MHELIAEVALRFLRFLHFALRFLELGIGFLQTSIHKLLFSPRGLQVVARFVECRLQLINFAAQLLSRLFDRCVTGHDVDSFIRLAWILRRGRQFILRRKLVLNSQNTFANFAAAIFHNGWLPIRMRFAQFVDQTSSESIFRQSRFKMVLTLLLFPLLGGHVGFEKNFAWIVLLRPNLIGCQKNQDAGK